MRRLLISITLLLFIAGMFAVAPELKYPKLNDVVIPEYEKVELPNGMTLYLMEDHSLPMITAYFRIDARTLYDPQGKEGLAEMVSDMLLLGGAGERTPEQVDMFLESSGAEVDVSANVNRATVTAKALDENFEEVFSLVADMMRKPMFDDGKIAWAKNQWKSGLMHRNDSPDKIGEREFPKALLGAEHPYAQHEEIYTIDAISKDDLFAYHHTYYVPENVDLGLVGDFDPAEIKKLVEKYFGDWQGTMPDKPPLPDFPVDMDEKVFFVQKDGLSQTTINLGHQGIREDSTDYYAANLITRILGAGRDARLYKEIRAKRGWVYTVAGWIGTGMDHPEAAQFFLQTSAENTVEAIKVIKEEIKKFQAAPPTDSEMANAKSAYQNAFPFRYQSPLSILSMAMIYDYYGYPKDYQETMLENVLAVTKDDVWEASKRLLRPDNMVIVIVGDSANIPNLSDLGDVEFVDISIPTEAPGSSKPSERTEETLKQGTEIMSKVIERMGSKDLNKVKDIKIKGKSTMSTPMGEMEATVTNCIVFGDQAMIKSDMELPFGLITQAYDGEKAWISMPQGKQELPEDQAVELKKDIFNNLPNLLCGVASGNIEPNFAGEKSFNDQNVLVVELAKDDFLTKLYIDPDTYMVAGKAYRAMTEQGPATVEEAYDEYHDINGIMMPYSVISMQAGTVHSEMHVDEVKINSGFSKDDFVMP